MRKHFLLFFLMALLPMAGWAQSLSYTTAKWDGSSHAFPTVTINDGTIPVGTTYYETGNNRYRVNHWRKSGSTTDLTQYQNTGDYVATVEHQSRANQYSAWGSTTYTTLNFTVTKAYPVVTLYGFQVPYSDSWTEPTASSMPASSYAFNADGTNLTWSGIVGKLTWSRSSTSHDVDTYPYTLTVDPALTNDNYEVKINPQGSLEITAVDGTWSTLPAGKATGATEKYDGTDKTVADLIANPAVYSGGTVEYSLDGLAWSEDLSTIVVGKDAKSYPIQYRGNGDKNHNDIAGGTFPVLIDQYEIVAGTDFTAPTALTKVYNDGEQEIAAAATWNDVALKAEIEAGAEFLYPTTTALPKETNVGQYDVKYTINVTDANFVWKGGTVTLTTKAEITKANIEETDVTAPTGKTDLEYKLDTPQQLLATAATASAKGTPYYSLDGGDWVTNIADAKLKGEHVKAGDAKYVVSWYIKGDANHNDYGSTTTPAGTVEVAIAPVQFTLKADAIPATGLVYNAGPQVLLEKSVEGGAANMPQGSTTWSLNGTALAAGSVYTDVKGTDAGTYHVSYTVVPKEAKYANDYLPYTKEDIPVFIGQYTLYIGAKTLSGNVETFFDLENGNAPKFKMSDFLKDGAFIGGETDTEKEAILNQLIAPTQTMDEIFAAAKVGSNVIGLQPVAVDPDKTPMNYKVDGTTLLSENASLDIEAIEAAIQADPIKATPTYNGDDQELIQTAAVGYKAMGGAGTDPAKAKAIGKVVYSLEEAGTYTDDLTTIVGKDADTYPVYYKVELSTEATSLDRFYKYDAAVKSINVTIAQKALDIAMFAFSDDDMTAVYTGENLMPTFEAFDAVAGDAEKNALAETDFTVAKTNSVPKDVTEMVDVDTYTFTIAATADGNYTGTLTPTFEITPKALDAEGVVFALQTASVEYDGDDHKADVKVVPTAPLKESDFTVALPAEMVNADEYTITLNATAEGNYSGSNTATFTITQKPLTADMFVFTEGVTFDGKAHKPTITTKEGEPIVAADYTYAITDGEDAAIEETALIDADTYTYTFTAAADGNYKNPEAPATVAIEWTIAQATAEIVLPTANNLTYNATDQALVTKGTTDAVDGLVEYQIKDSKDAVIVDWTDKYADVVQKNAGDYKVYYRITASAKNYTNPNVANAAEKPVAVTINKATVGYNLGNLTKTWNGELFSEEEIASLFTLYAGGEGGLLFGDDEYDRPFTITLPEDYRDAGTYTFKQPTVEFKEGYPVNYNVNFAGEAEIIINKADITEDDFNAPTIISPLTYDPTGELNPQALVNAGEVTAKYDAEYPTTELAGKAYGTIYYAQATTAPAEDATDWSEEIPAEINAGSYPVWYMVKGDKNHNNFVVETALPAAIGQYELSEEFLPETYKTALPYKGSSYVATDFVPELVGLTEGVDYTVGVSDMTNVKNDYTLLYAAKENSNYTGEFTVTVAVTPIDVIAVAPKGIKKVYDGTASLEGVITNEDITFVGVLSGDQIAVPEALALSTEGIAVSDKPYAITVDADAINEIAANKNYNILDETIDGTLTITKAPAFKVGFDEVPAWTKEFGEADPELTGYTVAVTDGEFFDDIADVLAATTAERAPGEDVDTYDVTLTIDATADVFANYEGVEFDGTAATFEITKADKVYTVSLANITETYNGDEFDTAIEFTAEDLVIAGYEGDKAKFFLDAKGQPALPTATLAAGAKNVGDYNITLTGGESNNFNFTFVPATFTIAPFEVTKATIANQKVQKGEELDVTKFTITAPEADADLFYVTAPGLVDMNDIVTGDAGVYADGLVIAVDESVADNYTGLDKFTAELEIISADAIILADDDDVETVAKEDQTVTFSSRTINQDTWNVMVLPFATTPAQISDAFGFAAVDVLNETASDGAIHFTLLTSGTIEAGQPFIVKPTKDSSEDITAKDNFNQVVFYDVDIEAFSDNTYRQDGANNKFWGTFKTTEFAGAEYWYMSKGVWKDASKYKEQGKVVTLKPLRAYVEFDSKNVATARIFIEEPDGSTTALDAVEFNNMINGEGWYTIDGKKLNAAPTQKGVYINNGKKVVVK